MKLKDIEKQDLLVIIEEVKNLLTILHNKYIYGFNKSLYEDINILNSYVKLNLLIENLDLPINTKDDRIYLEIANETRKLLDILKVKKFDITDNHVINSYCKLKNLLRFWDYILHYYDEFKTLPPKYDYNRIEQL